MREDDCSVQCRAAELAVVMRQVFETSKLNTERRISMEKRPENQPREPRISSKIAIWMGAGTALGIILGIATDNIIPGVVLGLVIGAAIGIVIDRQSRSQ